MSLLGKKFKLIDEFNQAKNGDYHLLPSRFSALDDGRYILSNEVGEYLITDRQQLDDFVHKKVSADTNFYHNLKSKHFLFDDDSNVAIDLLALKYRTKAQRIAQFTALHLLSSHYVVIILANIAKYRGKPMINTPLICLKKRQTRHLIWFLEVHRPP